MWDGMEPALPTARYLSYLIACPLSIAGNLKLSAANNWRDCFTPHFAMISVVPCAGLFFSFLSARVWRGARFPCMAHVASDSDSDSDSDRI